MAFLCVHTKGEQYLPMYTMYTNASNNIPFYTHINSYMVWRVQPSKNIGICLRIRHIYLNIIVLAPKDVIGVLLASFLYAPMDKVIKEIVYKTSMDI